LWGKNEIIYLTIAMQISRLNNGGGKAAMAGSRPPIFLAHRKSAEIQTALKEIMRKQNCRVRENSHKWGKTKQSGTKGKMRKQKGQDTQNVGKIIKERRDASDANEQTALIKISFP